MTEEIKEMNLSEMLFNRDERLLNYITNLQKENNSLKGNIKRYAKKVKNQRVEIDGLLKQRDKIKIRHIYLKKDLKDYKSRNEKAIDELFELKNMIYKPETREENFEIQRKISSIIKKLGLGGDE